MRTSASALSIVLVILSAPAVALDLTGTWSGKVACTGFDGAKFAFQMGNQTLKISQTGNRLSMRWLDEGNPFNDYVGYVIEDKKQPAAKGGAAVTACTNSTNLMSGFSEIANLNVKRVQNKGTLAGMSIYASNLYGLEVNQCKWTFTLIDPSNPNVPANCPSAN